jgi:hypothetical protein
MRRGEAYALERGTTHVAPQVTPPRQEIARRQTTLEQTTARLHRREATTKTIIEHGLHQQRLARHLGDRLRDYRDKIDGVPTAADLRGAASFIQQERGVATVRRHRRQRCWKRRSGRALSSIGAALTRA